MISKILKLFNRRIKFYGHFISLGYNCENAYRFFKRYKFVESSLFTWCNCSNIRALNNALVNFESILTGEINYDGYMWQDMMSNIFFHGVETQEFRQNPSSQLAEEFKNELRSRIEHLKTKFKNQGTDGKKNLYTFTYKIANESEEEILANIKELKLNLRRFCTNEFDLLIIFEKSSISLEPIDGVYYRYVNEFAPVANVTTKHYDKKSWNRILDEFRPDFKLKKTKKFKFEAV